MAIGTLAAVALGAGALGSAALGASASSKASKSAAKAATQASDQSAQVQREQLAVAQNALNPYANQGQGASYALNSFLGLTPTQQPQQTAQQPNALAQFQGGQSYGFEGMDGPGRSYSAQEPNVYGANSIGGAPFAGMTGYGGGVPQGGQPMVNGRDAFKSYIDNSDYAFQFGQGSNRVNSGYAGQGTLQSGAAMKGLEDYRQNLQSGYRNEFLGLLGNQQGVGLSAGSALAGVGQNFANSITGINNNRADAIGNAALLNGRNINNSLNGITSGVFGAIGRG